MDDEEQLKATDHFVACTWCKDWDAKQRYFDKCRRCNNSGLVPDPKEILCNLCGETMCPIGTMNEQSPHGLYNAHVTGGYDSYHLWDMTTYTFSLCEKCLREIFNKAKIKPDLSDAAGGLNPYTYEDDLEMYEYRLWKDAGGHHQAYLDKKCNMVKDCPNKAKYTELVSDDFTERAACEDHKNQNSGCINCKMVPFIPNVFKPYL